MPSRLVDHVGRVLGGRYRLIAPVGTGASANVFLSDDVTLRRRVAVKVLHAGLAGDDAFLRRFRAEAQAAAALNHPHVMRVYDWGEDADGPYLVAEWLGGGSLRDLLDRGEHLSPSQAVLLGVEAGRALDYAHRRGLVHRDIKPANLLFDEEGRLCIADFGLARALAEAAWTEPTGTLLGTARYASPEQASGQAVDGRADVYALALVLVEAVTGEVPFSADTTVATLMARTERPIPAAAELGPLGEVIDRAGAVDPSERLDAAGLVKALERVATQLPPPAPLPLAGSVPLDASRVADADPTLLPRSRPRLYDAEGDDGTVVSDHPDVEPMALGSGRRRRRWWLWALLALLLGGVVAAGALAADRVFVPEHEVPLLKGKTLDEARAEVAEHDFEIEVAEERFDEDIPAGFILEQSPLVGEQLREGEAIKVVVSTGPAPRAVPDLAGVDQAEAERRLREAGLEPAFKAEHHEEVPKGGVLDWAPKEGEHAKGTPVEVTVSDGPRPRTVPDVRGKGYDEAAAALQAEGLAAAKVEVFHDTVPAGQVVTTVPRVGSTVARGTRVSVQVSKGPDLVTVPDVKGLSVEEATARLEAARLAVSGVVGNPRRPVVTTRPGAGERVKPGTEVAIYTQGGG